MSQESDFLFEAAKLMHEITPEIPVNIAFGIVLDYHAVVEGESAVSPEKVAESMKGTQKKLVVAIFKKMFKEFSEIVGSDEEVFEEVRNRFTELRAKRNGS